MPSNHWGLGLLAVAMLLPGCDRSAQDRKEASSSAASAQPGPNEVAATTTQPTSRPTRSTLLINGQAVDFSRARLVLQQSQPTVQLLLLSDEPEHASATDRNANRFYFRMDLEIDGPEQLSSADWNFLSSGVERADEPDGIFLNDDRLQLKPYDVHIGFTKRGNLFFSLQVEGLFVVSNSPMDASGAPKTVSVGGEFVVELETPKAPPAH